ncbi:MAG: phosphopantetheine-binding protein [Pseudomonadota bacterium]
MSDAAEEDKLIRLAIDWVLENSPNAQSAGQEITGDTNLLEDSLLDSLGFVDLVAFLEKTTNREIDLLELDEDDLSTLQGLCRAACTAGTAA